MIVVIIDLSILFLGTAIPESRLTAVGIFDAEHEITITVCIIHVENKADLWNNRLRRWIMDVWTDRRTDGQTEKWTCRGGGADGWMDRRQMERQMD